MTVKVGTVRDLTRRQARKAADEKLRLLNQGQWAPTSTISLKDFVDGYFIPNFFPTLKLSTQKRYRQTLNTHLLPAFGKCRLCDLGTLDVQRFVLQKMGAGLGWESANHYRNLLSKVFTVAKKWGYFSGANPVAGVELPEKVAVREKHILTPDQATRLMEVVSEPVRTMVWLSLLTGLRIGEVLGLPWKNVDFSSGQIRITHTAGSTNWTPHQQPQQQHVHSEPLRGKLEALRRTDPGFSIVVFEDFLYFLNFYPMFDREFINNGVQPNDFLNSHLWRILHLAVGADNSTQEALL